MKDISMIERIRGEADTGLSFLILEDIGIRI